MAEGVVSAVDLEEFIHLDLLDYNLQYLAALNGLQFLANSILKRPFQVVDRQLTVPTGPGLGVEVDEEKLRTLLLEDVG